MRNRGVTAPPGLQNYYQSLESSSKSNIKTSSDSHSSPLESTTPLPRPSNSSKPLPTAFNCLSATPKKQKVQPTTIRAIRTPKRTKTQPSPPQAAPQPTPPSSNTAGSRIRTLGSLSGLLQEAETDDDMPDLSFMDDWSADDSKTLERFRDQPRTPTLSPGKTFSRFRDRHGVYHEVAAVIVDDTLRGDSGLRYTSRYGTALWNRKRSREPPTKIAEVEDGDELWKASPPLPSIERDVSMAPSRELRGSLEATTADDSGNKNDENEANTKLSLTRAVSIVPIDRVLSSIAGSETVNCELEDDDVQINADPNMEYYVKRITGEKIRPGIHEYRIEWRDYPGVVEWIPDENCSCPDAIAEFRELQRQSLFAAMLAGRTEEVESLQKLAESDRVEVENAIFPKHQGWRCQRRTARGRFAARGTSNSTLEILRLPTVPRNVRANTARPPDRRRLANSSCADEPTNGDEVVWICTEPREARGLWEQNMKGEAAEGMESIPEHRNDVMELREIQRRRKQDAREQRRAAEKEARNAKRARKQEKKSRKLAREVEEDQRRGLERKKSEKARRKEKKRQRQELEEQQRVTAEKKREEEEALKRKEMRKKARAEMQKLLEETVHKYRIPAVMKGKVVEETRLPPKTKKEKLQQTLADASESAARQENSHQPFSPSRISQAQRTRASSVSSVLSINEQFRKARSDEAKAKAKNRPRLVRSEFCKTLRERQAESLIKQSRIVPPTTPRRKTFSH